MDKKTSFLFFAFILIILSASLIVAEDVGYIVKTSLTINSNEAVIISTLEDYGHNVDFFDNSDEIDYSSYDFFIIGEDIINIDDIPGFDNTLHKTIFLSGSAAKNAGLSAYKGTTENHRMTILDNEHRITQDFILEDIYIYDVVSPINYLYGCQAINSKSLAYRTYDYRDVILVLREDSFLLEDGDCSNRNVPLNERNMFFGLSEASSWTLDSQDLFINSVIWLIEGEDNDDDGYYYNEDCDDSDDLVYQILPGYEDNDLDGFGTGDLIDVCSGDYLSEDYVDNDEDCDDSDDLVYQILPGYEDNDLDGFGTGDLIDVCSGDYLSEDYVDNDEDCDDSDDLVYQILPGYEDNDLDGFGTGDLIDVCSGDYLSEDYVDNDEDCDDSDDLVNPLGEEIIIDGIDDGIDQDCDNMVEIISKIPDLEWNEDSVGIFDLNPYFLDFDSDTLEFFILDTSTEEYISVESFEDGIIELSAKENWYGKDWMIFLVSDGEGYKVSNNVSLIVNTFNDKPTFTGIIENIVFREDTNLIDYINLNDYFNDIDDDLIFNVFGNNFIDIVINNGLVSFYPNPNWFGSEIINFSAKDSEEEIYSNQINITVTDANEPPIFLEQNCLLEILEDETYTCLLNASDIEEDEFDFEIITESNLNCDIDNNELEYESNSNYNGIASCLIEVKDGEGNSRYLFEVNITPVNDAPKIEDYSPKTSPLIMENTNQLFFVQILDIDSSNLETKWFLDDVEVETGTEYMFNQEQGNYELKVKVSDGDLTDSKTFEVFVGDLNDFTCNQVNGFVLEENEVCLQDLLQTKDSTTINCCPIKGSPDFKEIGRCSFINNSLNFEIKDPESDDEFSLGDIIDIELEIENNFDEDLEFDVEVYLYDVTNQEVIKDKDESIEIDSNDEENLNFEIEVLDDLEEDNDFSIFVKIIEEDETVCNEDYKSIDIIREKHNVVIDRVDVDDVAYCGDLIDFRVRTENLGSKDEDVLITIKNLELGISFESDTFELEKYDDDDTKTSILSVPTSQDIVQGDYKFDIVASFADKEDIVVESIFIDCKQVELESKPIEKIALNAPDTKVQTKESKTPLFFIFVIMFVFLFVLIILLKLFF